MKLLEVLTLITKYQAQENMEAKEQVLGQLNPKKHFCGEP